MEFVFLAAPVAELVGVPLFVGNPARGVGGEAQHGPVFGFAGEDAEAGAQVAFEVVGVEFAGGVAGELGVGDAVEGEGAKVVGVVAMGDEIPVVAVVQQQAGVDDALGGGVFLAAVVAHVERLRLQGGAGHGAEGLFVDFAIGDGLQADAGGNGVGRVAALLQQFANAAFERAEIRGKKSRLHGFEQLLGGEQRVKFAGVEPQSGQFELGGVGVVEVAIVGAVIEDRRVHETAHVFDVAFDARRGHVGFLHQALGADGRLAAQQAVNAKYALGAVHGAKPPFRSPAYFLVNSAGIFNNELNDIRLGVFGQIGQRAPGVGRIASCVLVHSAIGLIWTIRRLRIPKLQQSIPNHGGKVAIAQVWSRSV